MAKEILKIRIDNGLSENNPTFKDIELDDYSAKFPRMGFPELTATLMWPTPLDDEWTHKEFVVLRGEKFYVTDTPDAEKTNNTVPYKHDIGFTSEFARILGNTYFEDAVPSYSATYNKPCSNSSKFTFYGTIKEFCDRLNCSFIKAGIADSVLKTKTSLTTLDIPIGDGYCVMLDPYGEGSVYDPDKSYEFSWEDKSHWEAITEGFDKTEIPFVRRGKAIVFGALPKIVSHKFEYGHDNELLSVKHKNAKAKVINRITMQGSSENIPHYYPNETEYGHITLNVNKQELKDKFTIVNYHQLVNILPADKKAILSKYDEQALTESISKTLQFYIAYHNPDNFNLWKTDTLYLHERKPNEASKTFWYVKIRFDIKKSHSYLLSEIKGSTWEPNESPQTHYANLLQSGFQIKSLCEVFEDEDKENKDITEQVTKDDLGFHLGLLTAGTYEFTIYWKFDNATRYFKISGASIGDDYQKTGYYWAVGDKNYDGVGSLGLRLDGYVDIEDALGCEISWESKERMPFQDHLVPPKYRNTLGEERFYNALNAPYSEEYASEHANAYLDPDTNKPYSFEHPFIEGAPSEHIYKNEDIKPTIEGVTNSEGQLFGVIADIAYDDNDNDLLKSDATEDNDKNDSLKYEHSFFYIKLNIFNGQYGFDLFAHASQTDPMTIQMRDGSCNGCKFKIQSVKFTDDTGLETYKNPIVVKNGKAVGVISKSSISEKDLDPTQQDTRINSIWICVQKDAETFGVIMPNQSNIFKPQVGDTFNIINIDLPQAYILAAEKRLEEEGIRFMADNNDEKFTFDIQASRIFFEENPDVLAQLDEYSAIKVKYNGQKYEQYVNQLTIDCKSNEPLPNIGIDLTDELATSQSFVEQVAERASSLISNPYTMSGSGNGNSGGLTTRLADLRYLKKTEADRSKGKIASDIGFEIGEFVSGGSGGIFFIDPETGQTYIEADKLKVRMKAIFEELEIAKVSTIGGKFVITPGGGMNISFVEELADTYRCYFKAKDEDKGAACRFVVGDQVQCHEFNIQAGTTQNASNRYYWRLVTAVNNDESYIELSKSDCDNGYEILSNAPQAGDTIVQLGSRADDKSRQSAIILSTIDAFAPCVTLYNGIDNYSLDDKSVVEYGVDKTKNPPEPFFNCYGRFFFGPKGGNSYLKFEPSAGKLVFSGELINITKLNDKDIDEYIKDVVPPVTQEDIEGYVNAIVDPQIEGIQNQIDGVIETWFYNGVPTLTNYPASEWNTNDLKIQHLGDLYYDNDTGTAYRFSQDANGNYYWNTITDDAITKALAVANSKRRVFVSQPTPPYNKGDIWVNATYGTQYNDDILRCITDKESGTFNIADWTLASKYTDDTLAQQAIDTIDGYQYVRDAIKDGGTKIYGGLLLSQLIKLGQWDKSDPENPIQTEVWAGINGDRHHDKTIASWWGGPMIDKYYNDSVTPRPIPLTAGFASALVRMDGSAYFSRGNIGFNADGSGWLGGEDKIKFFTDGSMIFGNGIRINLSTGEEGLTQTIESFANLLRFFIPYSGNTKVEWTSENIDRIRVTTGLSSDSFISARGVNPNGGTGGSSFNLMRTWPSVAPSENTTDALAANLAYELRQKVLTLENKNYLNDLTISDSGTGNAITSVSQSSDKKTLTFTKGATFSVEGHVHSQYLLSSSYTASDILTKLKTVDGANSGLDADLLDGINGSSYLRKDIPNEKTDEKKVSELNATDNSEDSWLQHYSLSLINNNNALNFYVGGGYNERTALIQSGHKQNDYAKHLGSLHLNKFGGNVYINNVLAATINSNVASATKLNDDTEFKVWGQTFFTGGKPTGVSGRWELNGADSGSLSIFDGISYRAIQSYQSKPLCLNPIGNNVGIGTESPAYKLDVNGTFHSADNATVPRLNVVGSVSSTAYLTADDASNAFFNIGGRVILVMNNSQACVRPGLSHNNIFALGATNARWSNLYSVLGNFSGKVTAQSLQIGDCVITYENGGLHFSSGIYSDSFISARGKNASGGTSSSGGVAYNRLDKWSDYTSDKSGYVLSALLGYDLYTNKLSLSGGTLTGGIAMKFDTDSSRAWGYTWKDTNNNTIAQILMHNTADRIIINPIGAESVWNDSDTKSSLIIGRNELTYNTKAILTSGNYASILNNSYVTLNTTQTISAVKTFTSAQSNQITLRRTSTSGGSFIDYYANNSTSDLWRVGMDAYNHFAFSWGLNSIVVTIDGNGNIEGNSFIKKNGTASQALMANGSTRNVHTLSSQTNLGWSATIGQLASIDTLAWWNGQYNDGHSSLQYCDRGRFGTMATATASDYLARAGGSMTTTSVVTNLNADIFDGHHGEWYQTHGLLFSRVKTATLEDHADANTDIISGGMLYNYVSASAWENTPAGMSFGQILMLGSYATAALSGQLAWDVNHGSDTPTRNLWWRAGSSSHSFRNDWHQIAFTDSNVASATKLETARTLWGQSFNGTANVTGNMSSVGDITPAKTHTSNLGASNLVWERIYGRYIDTDSGYNLRICVVGNEKISVQASNGYVGINKTVPSYQLDVAGIIHSTTGIFSDGYISARGQNTSSDERLKTIIRNVSINVEDIAKAPIVDFQWKSGGGRDVGSIAQYWQRINPLLTPKAPNGFLTLQYGKTALIGLVSVSKEVVLHTKEIQKLQIEIRNLKERIRILENKQS